MQIQIFKTLREEGTSVRKFYWIEKLCFSRTNFKLLYTIVNASYFSCCHCGAGKGQLETLKVLAKNGANLWLKNQRGDLPLHEAVHSGMKDLVRWLLHQRPDATDASNNDGRCPLHIAAINNHVEMCKVREILL